MWCDAGVEHAVEVVEEVHHLYGGAGRRHGREVNHVTEVNGDRFKQLWLHDGVSLKLLGHRSAIISI